MTEAEFLEKRAERGRQIWCGYHSRYHVDWSKLSDDQKEPWREIAHELRAMVRDPVRRDPCGCDADNPSGCLEETHKDPTRPSAAILTAAATGKDWCVGCVFLRDGQRACAEDGLCPDKIASGVSAPPGCPARTTENKG